MLQSRSRILSFICLCLLTFSATTAVAVDGDAERGKALFTGHKTFENGGAPCLACHDMVGVGLTAGANYGPDLSQLYNNYGLEGLEGVLPTLPFPSMEPIFATRPLNESEQADLIIFFQKAAPLSETPGPTKLAGQVILGVIVLLGLTVVIGLKRIRPVRRSLIENQRDIINKGGLQ